MGSALFSDTLARALLITGLALDGNRTNASHWWTPMEYRHAFLVIMHPGLLNFGMQETTNLEKVGRGRQ